MWLYGVSSVYQSMQRPGKKRPESKLICSVCRLASGSAFTILCYLFLFLSFGPIFEQNDLLFLSYFYVDGSLNTIPSQKCHVHHLILQASFVITCVWIKTNKIVLVKFADFIKLENLYMNGKIIFTAMYPIGFTLY